MSRFDRKWTGFICLLQLSLFAAWGNLAHAQPEAEDRMLAAICQNGLSASAVRYATAQRNLASDDAEAYAKWTMRLMECQAQKGLLDSEKGEENWRQCHATFEAFQASRPDDARLPWLEWQLARCELVEAQANLARYLAAPSFTGARDRALELIRGIERRVERLVDDIRERMPLAARQSLEGGSQAPAEQLARLMVDSGLLRCEALLIRMRLYQPGSRDRVAAATNVERQAEEVMRQTGPDWDSYDALQLAKARAELELGARQSALKVLLNLASQSRIEERYRQAAAVTAVENLATHGQVEQAREVLRDFPSEPSPALELAELAIALAELPSEKSAEHQRAVADLVARARQLGESYGDYWRNRAEALLTGAVSPSSVAGDTQVSLELMVAEVRQLLAADDMEGAVRQLLRFRDNEAAARRGEAAIELVSLAAALLQREGQWLEASDVLSGTCLEFRETKQAAECHLRAGYCLSQALRAKPNDDSIRKKYESCLEQQLSTWPDSAHSDEAQAWLGRWLAGRDRLTEFTKILAHRAAGCQDPNVRGRVLAQWMITLLAIPGLDGRAGLLSQMEQLIAARAFGESQTDAKVLHLTAKAFSTWASESEAAKIATRSEQLRTSVSQPEHRNLLAAVDLLQLIRSGMRPARRKSSDWGFQANDVGMLRSLGPAFVEAVGELSGGLQTAWAERLDFSPEWADKLIEADTVARQAAGYRMLLWCGETEAGLQGLNQLVDRQPRNGALQLQLAAALANSGPDGWTESTKLAKRIAANSSPGSELFFAARWRLISNLLLQGEKGKAQSQARLVLAAQPIESEHWRERFERVARGE